MGAGIRLPPMPEIEGDAQRAFVIAIRELLTESRFHTLEELGKQLKPVRRKQRLSELARGHRLPDEAELGAVVKACSASELPRLQSLLRAARDERIAAAAAPVPQLSDLVVTTTVADRLPLVREFRNWTRLGVHPPITQIGSGDDRLDLSERVDSGELPAYVVREKDLEPGTGLRPMVAAMATGGGPPVRLVVIAGEPRAGKTRAAVEAMRTELSHWRLLIPRSAERLAQLLDQHPDLRQTVVWLDEVQELLGQDRGLEQLERLLDLSDGPTLLLATLCTDAEINLTGTAAARLLTNRAHRITLHRRPLRAEDHERELARARELHDPWIADALTKIGSRYGIVEWLAADPQLLTTPKQTSPSQAPAERTTTARRTATTDNDRPANSSGAPEPLPNPAVSPQLTSRVTDLGDYSERAPAQLDPAQNLSVRRISPWKLFPLSENHGALSDVPKQDRRRRHIKLLGTLSIVALALAVIIVLLQPTQSRSPSTTIPVGLEPLWVAISPDGRHAYTVNAASNTVSVIDTASNKVISTVSVPGAARVAVTPDGRHAYVTSCPDCGPTSQGSVSVIETATNKVTATFPAGLGPFGVASSPDGRYIYVTDRNSGSISVINTTNNTVIATIRVGTFPTAVAVSPDGRYVYVTNASGPTVSVIDTHNNTVTATISAGSGAFSVAVSPDGRHTYVTDLHNSVAVIDTTSNTVTTTIPIGQGGSRTFAVTVSPNGRHAYVTNNTSNTVSVIDTASNMVTSTISVQAAPTGVAVTPDGQHGYITNHDSNTVSVIYTGTN